MRWKGCRCRFRKSMARSESSCGRRARRSNASRASADAQRISSERPHQIMNRTASMCLVALSLCVIAAIGCARTGGEQRSDPTRGSGNAWEALSRLPDWSGAWIPDLEDQFAQIRSNPVPWTPEVAAKVARLNQLEEAGRPKGLFTNCLPEAMPGWMLVSHNAMEVLFTPGRVTMLGESDGNRLRRVYTDGRPHPAVPDPSFHGHSIE